ncbi:MAG TPA: hypothetical protein PKE03_08370 [Bacteroidales bacterium]|nr:hypothetical protein [Bacteroidales bacterium]
MRGKNKIIWPVACTFVLISLSSCSGLGRQIADNQHSTTIVKNFSDEGIQLEISFLAGKAHNHPTFAVWLEDPDGHLLQTIFVTRSVATGYFNYGDAGDGRWQRQPGRSIRPAALPVWLHKREDVADGYVMPTPENPVADAYTGPTPKSSFNLSARTKTTLTNRFRLLVEVNQPWDWNRYWHNDRFPGDYNYRTSAQPSLIYAVDIDLSDIMPAYYLNPIGHGHPSGDDGKIYTDLSGHTTATDIFRQIKVIVKR